MTTQLSTPCREWQGERNKNYGKKWDRVLKKRVLAHRWVVAQIDGWDAIRGKVVMHLCDNPSCFRYDHLRIATQADNNADMAAKGRHGHGSKTHCKNGHPYDEANTHIEPDGRRTCRTCSREKSARYQARKKAVR